MKINAEQFKQIISNFDVAARSRTAFVGTLAAKLDALEHAQILNNQRFAALEKVVIEHDEWAKAYNVTVEARNAEAMARSRQMGEEYDAWRKQQLDAVVSVVEMFQKMQETLNFIQHELLVQPSKPKSKRRAK